MKHYFLRGRSVLRVSSLIVSVVVSFSFSLSADMSDLTDCHNNCFERKQACHEGVEDALSNVSTCQSDLVACKESCAAPERGYRPVQGIQLAFKFTPLVPGPQALFMMKKKQQEDS